MKEEFARTTARFENTITALKNQVVELHEKCEERDRRIALLEREINEQQQRTYEKNVVIRNINKKEEENLNEIVESIAALAGLNLSKSDVDGIYRAKGKHENIIVKFSSVRKKRELMKNLRSKKSQLKTNILGDKSNSAEKPIYVNGHLTRVYRQLLWAAKNKANTSGWQFVWVKEGNVLAKKGENSSFIYINSVSDIDLIK